MITMVLMHQLSSCLVNVSHTPFDGLELPSGITKNARRGHLRSVRFSGKPPSFVQHRPETLSSFCWIMPWAAMSIGVPFAMLSGFILRLSVWGDIRIKSIGGGA